MAITGTWRSNQPLWEEGQWPFTLVGLTSKSKQHLPLQQQEHANAPYQQAYLGRRGYRREAAESLTVAVAQEGQGVDGAIRGGELLGDRLGTDRSWLGCLGDGEFKDWNPPQ